MKYKTYKKPENNINGVVKFVLKSLKIRFTNSYINDLIKNFPVEGNIDTYSFVFDHFFIKTLPVCLSYYDLIDINFKTLIYLQNNEEAIFGVLIHANEENIQYYIPNIGYLTDDSNVFKGKWLGVALLINNQHSFKMEPNYIAHILIENFLNIQFTIFFLFTYTFFFYKQFYGLNNLAWLIFYAGILFILYYILEFVNDFFLAKFSSENEMDVDERQAVLKKHILDPSNQPTYVLESPLIRIRKVDGLALVLFLSPYDIMSARIFNEIINYSRSVYQCNISVGFIGSKQDALYCQFAGFIAGNYSGMPMDLLMKSLLWWFDQGDKNFDKFYRLFPQRNNFCLETLKSWNKATEIIGSNGTIILANGYLIPNYLKSQDLFWIFDTIALQEPH